MNITRLNSSGDIIIKKGSGGKNGMKYYDCLFDKEEHEVFVVDSFKWVGMEGNCVIGPEIPLESDSAILVAVAADVNNRKVYKEGKWMSQKEWLIESDGFNPDTHTEITEEEFYHIPDDVVWDCNTEEGCKEAFESLWKLCERYEGKFNEENPLPLYFWHKSIDLVKYGPVNNLYGFTNNKEYQDIYLTAGESIYLRRQGNSYTLVSPKLIYDAESYDDRKALYEYLENLENLEPPYQNTIVEPPITLINYQSGSGGGPTHIIKFIGYNPDEKEFMLWTDTPGGIDYIANLNGPNEHWAGYPPYALYYAD